MSFEGACLCGEVKIVIPADQEDQIICHCWDCKQSSGSAYSTFVLVPKKDVKITGPTKVFEKKNNNGNIVSRVFCSNCGSPISHFSKAYEHTQAVRTAHFVESQKLPIGSEFWTRTRWDSLTEVPEANQMKTMP